MDGACRPRRSGNGQLQTPTDAPNGGAPRCRRSLANVRVLVPDVVPRNPGTAQAGGCHEQSAQYPGPDSHPGAPGVPCGFTPVVRDHLGGVFSDPSTPRSGGEPPRRTSQVRGPDGDRRTQPPANYFADGRKPSYSSPRPYTSTGGARRSDLWPYPNIPSGALLGWRQPEPDGTLDLTALGRDPRQIRWCWARLGHRPSAKGPALPVRPARYERLVGHWWSWG